MPASYTVKLPDGNEYGPVDLATLRSWHDEGRIGPDTWVWPEGSPEWLTLIDVLAGAGQDPAGAETPLRLKAEPREKRASMSSVARSPSRPRSGTVAKRRPIGLFLGLGAALVALGGAVGFVLLAPGMEKDRTKERVLTDSLPDRRFADDALGLALDLPPGWVLLKPDSSLFLAPQARARLAHPETGTFAALLVESLPPGVTDLDAFLDRAVDTRRALIAGHREIGRAVASVSGRPARRLQVAWTEGGGEQAASILATQDAWAYFALAAWGPVRVGPAVPAAVDALLAALQVKGTLDARVKEAADVLQAELPELSRPSLELILRDRLGNGAGAEEVGDAAIRAASQGVPALTPDEARELQGIYSQVYDPMPEADRQRLASWQRTVRASRPVAPEEAQALRILLRDAVAALPEDGRLRLQSLNEKAIAAAYALR